MARGHISASFHLQRSNEGPLESSRQGAHDRAITPNAPKMTYSTIWASTLDLTVELAVGLQRGDQPPRIRTVWVM